MTGSLCHQTLRVANGACCWRAALLELDENSNLAHRNFSVTSVDLQFSLLILMPQLLPSVCLSHNESCKEVYKIDYNH